MKPEVTILEQRPRPRLLQVFQPSSQWNRAAIPDAALRRKQAREQAAREQRQRARVLPQGVRAEHAHKKGNLILGR